VPEPCSSCRLWSSKNSVTLGRCRRSRKLR